MYWYVKILPSSCSVHSFSPKASPSIIFPFSVSGAICRSINTRPPRKTLLPIIPKRLFCDLGQTRLFYDIGQANKLISAIQHHHPPPSFVAAYLPLTLLTSLSQSLLPICPAALTLGGPSTGRQTPPPKNPAFCPPYPPWPWTLRATTFSKIKNSSSLSLFLSFPSPHPPPLHRLPSIYKAIHHSAINTTPKTKQKHNVSPVPPQPLPTHQVRRISYSLETTKAVTFREIALFVPPPPFTFP